MDAAKTASVTFEQNTRTLEVTVTGEGGSVTPGGTATHGDGDEVTLQASWNDATHDFTGWGGDCSGTSSTCVLTMDADKSVTATFAALPATRCATTTASDCIRAVYRGAPGDYAQVSDIPSGVLITPGTDGRYYVERGQQITVVTAAPLPSGWTRFYLERSPLQFGTPSPVSFSQLIPPVGTTYTFTPTADEGGSTLVTFDLKEARPFVRPRPDGKPEIGAAVVTTVFSVETTSPRYGSYDTTGAVATAGSYALLTGSGDDEAAVTTYDGLRGRSVLTLRIHESDAHGASQATLYDAVEEGHLIEWRQAGDCFVRYRATDVPAAEATAAYREFRVRAETYAWQSCQTGSLSTETSAVHVTAAPELALRQLGGTDLTDFAVMHGAWQLTPYTQSAPGAPGSAPSSIALQPVTQHTPPAAYRNISAGASSGLAELRRLPGWRDPAWLPAGVSLDWAEFAGPQREPVRYGYRASYDAADGFPAVKIVATYAELRGWRHAASWTTNDGKLGVREPIIVAGRPAYVEYSPPGAQHIRFFSIVVAVYDPATETRYVVYGFDPSLIGGTPEAVARVVRIACGLFESAGECAE